MSNLNSLEELKLVFKDDIRRFCRGKINKDWLSIYINNGHWQRIGIEEQDLNYIFLDNFIRNYYNINKETRDHSTTDINNSIRLYHLIKTSEFQKAYNLIEYNDNIKNMLYRKYIANTIRENNNILSTETNNIIYKFDMFSKDYLNNFKNNKTQKKYSKKYYVSTIY